MSRPRYYKLHEYERAVIIVAQRYNRTVRIYNKKGSAVGFEVFILSTDTTPDKVWIVHTQHNKKREVWSQEDYKKPSRNIGGDFKEFMTILENL